MRADTALIVLGASKWPYAKNFEFNPSFARSARDVVTYFSDNFGVPEVNLLDLFDNPADPAEQNRVIYQFLLERQKNIQNLLIYYIGHGGFASNNDYYLSLQCTSSWNPGISSIRVLDLAKTLRESASQLRRFLILDSCFSASAIPPFMSNPLEVAVLKTQDAMPTRGTALLCSSGSRDPSKAPVNEDYTMFTGSLLGVLREGIPDDSIPMLSLLQLGELIEQKIFAKFADEAVRPELHRPNQSSGDIAKIPLFPNLARPSTTASSSDRRVFVKDLFSAKTVIRDVDPADAEGLFSRDPVRAFGAAASLISSSNPISKEFLARLDFWSFASEMAAEKLLTARPELSRTLAEIVTDRSFHFTVRITAADALRSVHKSFAGPPVYELYRASLGGSFDDQRIAIEALGRMGEDPGLADLICDSESGFPKSDYQFEKLNTYVAEALCRVFVNTGQTPWGFPSTYQIEKVWKTIVRRTLNPTSEASRLVRILAGGKPLHAEVISEWLVSDSEELQGIAIEVLGQMAVKRLGRKVLAFATAASPDLQQRSYMALSGIGTTECVQFLEQQVRESKGPCPADFPLLLASHAIRDPARLTLCLELLLDHDVFEKFLVWRIAGLRQLGEFEMRIVEALSSNEPVERGTAALALSRLDPAKYRDAIGEVFEEASGNIETTLSSLAVINTGMSPLFSTATDTLRTTLQEYSYGLRVQIKDDVISVLGKCGYSPATELGQCWAEVYRQYPMRY